MERPALYIIPTFALGFAYIVEQCAPTQPQFMCFKALNISFQLLLFSVIGSLGKAMAQPI